jgi:hypothetical protein
MQADAAPKPLTPWASDRSVVVAALRSAAVATGSDFNYLLGTAMRESSLRPNAQSRHSSAAGLFQFIEQTWLGLVKTHGAQYGLGGYADAIRKGGDGRYHVQPALRETILALRKDPQASALMAGEYAKTTQTQLRNALGRDVCGGELYAAHFLGPEAACRLIRLNQSHPDRSAAACFPQAAGSNHNVFYHANGSAKSVREVYAWAMRQPGGQNGVQVAALPDITPVESVTVHAPSAPAPSARAIAAQARDAQVQMLMASVLNWQPTSDGGGDGFSAMFGNNMPGGPSPLSFGPGLLSILSDARTRSGSGS